MAESEDAVGGGTQPGPALRSVGVSTRESEVLALVASGLTNDQIGRRRGISARTVNKHLEHLFAKTGLTNRTQAAAHWHALQDRSLWRRLP